MGVPPFQRTLCISFIVVMNHTASGSEPSTVSLKFLAASILTSWSKGGVRNSAAIALFLKMIEKSGFSWMPLRDRTLPFSICTQRPCELSCSLNWAMRFLSLSRLANLGKKRGTSRSASAMPKRMIENRM